MSRAPIGNGRRASYSILPPTRNLNRGCWAPQFQKAPEESQGLS